MHCQYVDANSSAFFYYQIVARNLVIFQSNSLVRASETMKSNTKVIRKKSWIELTLGVDSLFPPVYVMKIIPTHSGALCNTNIYSQSVIKVQNASSN